MSVATRLPRFKMNYVYFTLAAVILAVGSHAFDEPIRRPIQNPPLPSSLQTENQRPPPPSMLTQHLVPPTLESSNQRPPPPPAISTQNQRPPPPKLKPESSSNTHIAPPLIDTDTEKPSRPNVFDFGHPANQQPEYVLPSEPEHTESFNPQNRPPLIDMEKPSKPNVFDFGNPDNQQPEYIYPSQNTQKPEYVAKPVDNGIIEVVTPKYPKHPPKING